MDHVDFVLSVTSGVFLPDEGDYSAELVADLKKRLQENRNDIQVSLSVHLGVPLVLLMIVTCQ